MFTGKIVVDSTVVGWILAIVLGVAAYQIPAFVRYIRSTPQQMLAFHGPDAPITKTTSAGEIRSFLSYLHDGGLLLDFEPDQPDVLLDKAQWEV